MNAGELLAYCSGVLAAHGALPPDDGFVRPPDTFGLHQVRLCACRRIIPPKHKGQPGPMRKWCSPNCTVRVRQKCQAARRQLVAA